MVYFWIWLSGGLAGVLIHLWMISVALKAGFVEEELVGEVNKYAIPRLLIAGPLSLIYFLWMFFLATTTDEDDL
jgi:hypothetical protein